MVVGLVMVVLIAVMVLLGVLAQLGVPVLLSVAGFALCVLLGEWQGRLRRL